MLNYWRTTGAANGGNSTLTSRPTTPLFLPAASPFSDYGFDGPFFDLEFTLSNHIDDHASPNSGEEDMREIELNLDAINQTYKPRSSTESNHSEENPKFPLSLVKTAGKFGVLFRKPNSSNAAVEKIEKPKNELLRVKFKVDEVKGPLISLFARDCSISEDPDTNSDSEKLGKEILHKYLNILKPLYVRVEKMKFSGQLRGPDCGGAASPPPEMAKSGFRSNSNLQAGIKVVRKHLGKSRSTSAVVSPPGNRRDDSLLEVQDGIQGAILHCKRSFHSNRERELSQSVSDACCEKSVISSTLYSGKVV